MKDRTLLQTQKNWVFDAVRSAELLPNEFTWDRDVADDGYSQASTYVSVLRHKSARFYFEFGWHRGDWLAVCSPGDGQRESSLAVTGWRQVQEHCSAWLKRLRAELAAPDLWQAAREAAEIAAPTAAGPANTPFSGKERERVRSALEEFRRYLESAHSLNSQQRTEVGRRIDYLSGAVERLGRIDWFEVFVSNIVGLALGGVLNAKTVGDAMHTARTMFGWILTEGVKLLAG